MIFKGKTPSKLVLLQLQGFAQHHKRTCQDEDCTLSLLMLGDIAERILNRELTDEEMRAFL